MTPERYQQVGQIYRAALELESDLQTAYLAEACAGDESLRQEVISLLGYRAQNGGLIDQPILEAAARAMAKNQAGSPVQSSVGQIVGHYRMISLLGQGGMGEVWLAVDILLGRKVALKLLPAEFTADADRVRRFAQEARAASALNHPNIITIYEIGETDNTHYIVTEYVEGKTLRQQMDGGRMKVREALDVILQLASALEAAHRCGIVHRDIKPENLMVRPDGYVKVLDFGLAKLVEPSSPAVNAEQPAMILVNTESGLLMGTPRCMSPEQARGERVDARTDIFSLGVVLYEMVAGRAPFTGATRNDVIAAILKDEPPSFAESLTEVPHGLEPIVSKTLRKNREERYQTAGDLLGDLRHLKEKLSIAQPQTPYLEETSKLRASFLSLGGFRSVLAIVCVLAILAAAAWFYMGRRPLLTDTDTILLGDFENETGEDIFDGTLKRGLAIQLTQTPFLQLFPETQVRQTLRLMARSPDERVAGEVARGICIRQNLKAFVTGSIAPFGSHYVITLEAIKGESGEVLAHEQVEAESKEQVMSALSQAARRLRGKLGESLSSIERFHKPLEEATTSDLEAFRFYTQGQQLALSGRVLEAIPFYERAAEIDPNFGSAYSHLAVFYWLTGRPALAADRAGKAYKLRDRLTEQEKLRLTFRYHVSVTGDLNKAIEVATLVKRMYPRWSVPVDLAMACDSLGKSDEVILEARESIRLLPQFDFPYRLLAKALLRLNRFAEAKDVLAMAPQQRLDTRFHFTLYQIAFINNHTAGMQQQVEWARGKPDEHVAFEWQAASAAFAGQWRKAQELSRHATKLASSGANMAEVAAGYVTEQVLRGAVFADCQRATVETAEGLALERGRAALPRAALALCGEINQVKPLVDELTKRYPEDTLLNSIWLPAVGAATELRRGNATQAIARLEASRYEAAAEFWPQYLRGQAYLKLKQSSEAATEFQRILDHRGYVPLSVLYPLAHLGLARAAALSGDVAKSRAAYDEFFKMWKSADADLPILIEAKREYAKK